MNDTTLDDPLDYSILIQDAFREVVRRSLEIVARDGLPGEHHFYITFRTDAPGVEIPQNLRDQYPEVMTVVLQHQFRDLTVAAEKFSVTLFFGQVGHWMEIPFSALVAFADPSASLQLSFLPLGGEVEIGGEVDSGESGVRHWRSAEEIQVEKEEWEAAKDLDGSSESEAEKNNEAKKDNEAKKNNVVSMDAFRRK